MRRQTLHVQTHFPYLLRQGLLLLALRLGVSPALVQALLRGLQLLLVVFELFARHSQLAVQLPTAVDGGLRRFEAFLCIGGAFVRHVEFLPQVVELLRLLLYGVGVDGLLALGVLNVGLQEHNFPVVLLHVLHGVVALELQLLAAVLHQRLVGLRKTLLAFRHQVGGRRETVNPANLSLQPLRTLRAAFHSGGEQLFALLLLRLLRLVEALVAERLRVGVDLLHLFFGVLRGSVDALAHKAVEFRTR